MNPPSSTGQAATTSTAAPNAVSGGRFLSWDLKSRIMAVLLTLALAVWLDDWDRWVGFVISFGFAHYLLSLYYARPRIVTLVQDGNMLIPLLGLGMLLALVVFMRFPLEIYFGIHHACNEAYLRRYHGRGRSLGGSLAAARGLFHLAAYLCILRIDPQVAVVPEPALWSFLAVATVALAHQSLLAARQEGAGLAAALRDSSVEWLVLLAVGASLFVQITFLQLVMYHFVLWTIVPIPMLRQRGRGPLVEYGLLSAGALLLFLGLTVMQLLGGRASLAFWYAQFYFWSYVHITTSFALSSAHPAWIVNIFRSERKAAGS